MSKQPGGGYAEPQHQIVDMVRPDHYKYDFESIANQDKALIVPLQRHEDAAAAGNRVRASAYGRGYTITYRLANDGESIYVWAKDAVTG